MSKPSKNKNAPKIAAPFPPTQIAIAAKKPPPEPENVLDSATASTTHVASAAGADNESNSSGSARGNLKRPYKSDESKSSESTPIKVDKYAHLKKKMKIHKSPRAAKQTQKLKKALPPPGNGRINKIYTTGCADGSVIAFAMHKKKPNEFAFTKVVDDQLKAKPELKEAMGIDNVFLRVDPDNGNRNFAVEYTNKSGDSMTKYASIYHRKPNSETTKAKRETWARRSLIRHFNTYAGSKYIEKNWGEEKFEYGADLEASKWTDYLADFINNEDVAKVMKEDFAYGDQPLTCTEMAGNRELVEMYYGPDKIDEGIRELQSKSKNFHAGDSDNDSIPVPYQSDEDGDDDIDDN